MGSFTQKLTRTLRLDSLAKTLSFSSSSPTCCPDCRLVQPRTKSKTCRAGCNAQPRRIAAGDEEFFERLPAKLEVIGEDPQELRENRVRVGLVTYVVALLFVAGYAAGSGSAELAVLGVLFSSIIPIAIAMAPRFKRLPRAVSNELSAVPEVRRLPPRVADSLEGTVHPIADDVAAHLDGSKCVACSLSGIKGRGIIVRSNRGRAFQLKSSSALVVVRGPFELVGEATMRAGAIESTEIRALGLKDCDVSAIDWIEHVVRRGDRVRVYGAPEQKHAPELSPYREQVADLIESPTGTVVELL